MSLLQKAEMFGKFQVSKRLKKYRPIVALLFLTSRCNLSCKYCFAEHQGEYHDLTIEQWKYIIAELKRHGCSLIFLMGGEPLLYKGFEELIDYAKSLGLMVHLTTNGILIPQYIEALRKVDMLMVSLDGDEAANNANRGGFQQVIEGIESAKQAGIPIRINAVMTRCNVNSVQWLLNFGDSIGAYVGFTIPARPKHPEQIHDMLLNDGEIRSLHLYLLKLAQEGRKITLSTRSLEHVIKYAKSYNELIMKGEGYTRNHQECMYGRYIIFVGANGDVYPCTSLWEMKETYQPLNIFRYGLDVALVHAQELPCYICYCAGGIEWDNMSSFRGLGHALKFNRRKTK